jgi:pilus assembly protein CpaB
MRRANVLVALGAVLVIVGIGLAWAVGRDDGGDGPEGEVAVVVAVEDLAPGESGEDIVASGKVEVEQVPAHEVQSGALRSTAELDGTIVGAAVDEGRQVVAASLRSAVLRGEAIDIPEGKQAVAVTVAFTAGVAGYAGPGDHVNVYKTVVPGAPNAPASPLTQLVLSDVEVLDVSEEVAPRRADPIAATEAAPAETTPTRSGAAQITLLLALDAEQAEKVVFGTTIDELYFTLVPEDQGPSEAPGVDYETFGTGAAAPAEAAAGAEG